MFNSTRFLLQSVHVAVRQQQHVVLTEKTLKDYTRFKMSFFTSDCSLHESTGHMDLYQAKQVNAYFLNFGKNLSQFCSFSSGSFASSRFIINAWKQTHRKDKVIWNWWSKAAKSLAQTQTVVWNRTCPGSLESEVLGRKSQCYDMPI
jgi:hypothetical protein